MLVRCTMALGNMRKGPRSNTYGVTVSTNQPFALVPMLFLRSSPNTLLRATLNGIHLHYQSESSISCLSILAQTEWHSEIEPLLNLIPDFQKSAR